MVRTPGPGRRGREAGQAATEYVAMVVATTIVLGAVLAVLAATGAGGQLVSGLKSAICAVVPGTSCGEGVPAPVTEQPEQEQEQEDGGDWDCSGFWGCTWNATKQTGSGLFNVGKGAVDDVVGIWDLVTDPGSLVDAGEYAWDHPGDAALSLVWDEESSQMWDREDYGGSVGRTVWNVGSWFIPGVDAGRAAGVLGKLGKAGKVAESAADLGKLARLSDEAAEFATAAEKAGDAGDLAAVEKAAEEARKRADDAKDEALGGVCAVALRLPGADPGGPAGSVLAFGGGGRVPSAVLVLHAAKDCTEEEMDDAWAQYEREQQSKADAEQDEAYQKYQEADEAADRAEETSIAPRDVHDELRKADPKRLSQQEIDEVLTEGESYRQNVGGDEREVRFVDNGDGTSSFVVFSRDNPGHTITNIRSMSNRTIEKRIASGEFYE
ncbi:hypothetical protein LWF15_02140 [Kineosporia rhizophila]|uniref:hypothetical protein n=1 Tax=Kineosporia rhizophila TaxID=84633 RepID=UPI001E6578EA|nr:hypothetical protein [Kineosporia rhizophila]MCE0534299.1 hypothetical protein [Kineosporia rhizophila]